MAAMHASQSPLVRLQILEDEREDMQPQMARLLEEWLGPSVSFVQSKGGQSVVDIAGTLWGHKVLMNKLKTDNGGNARIELLVSLMILL